MVSAAFMFEKREKFFDSFFKKECLSGEDRHEMNKDIARLAKR